MENGNIPQPVTTSHGPLQVNYYQSTTSETQGSKKDVNTPVESTNLIEETHAVSPLLENQPQARLEQTIVSTPTEKSPLAAHKDLSSLPEIKENIVEPTVNADMPAVPQDAIKLEEIKHSATQIPSTSVNYNIMMIISSIFFVLTLSLVIYLVIQYISLA